MSVTFSTVRQVALSLDGVEEVSSYGTPGFKVRGALFARFHQDGESLVVRMAIDKRDDMIATDPDTYFITDHYLNYPWILVRPTRIQPEA
ncbi:MAG: MmcQ/YjbR family DNA-binding protein, partial [Candidatus Acidiferrales bacterium]